MRDLYDVGTRKDGKSYWIHARKIKRAENNNFRELDCAFDAGSERYTRKNPYPAGKRHDAFEAGRERAHERERRSYE